MKYYEFTCPHCKEVYQIKNYSLGFCDAYEMRCDLCSRTLMVEYYIPPMDKLQEEEMVVIEEALNPCICGGNYRYNSPYRCANCNEEVPLEEIVKQIQWPGTLRPGFKPGVALGEILHSDRFEAWKPEFSAKKADS